MTDEKLLFEVLKSKSEQLTYKEIEAILDEELDKAPNEMDTELVRLCLDALTSENVENKSSKRIKMPILKIVAIVAVIVVVFAVSITAGAKFFHINAPEGVVKVNGDHFSVDMNNTDVVEDIYAQLGKDCVGDAVLPKLLTDYETKITNYKAEFVDSHDMIEFDFDSSEFNGRATIEIFEDDYKFNEKKPLEIDNYEVIEKEGVSILVFGNEKASNIQYCCKNVEYIITVDCDLNTALEIAKTI